MLESIRVGQTLTNNDIVSKFSCGNMGGMRRSLATNSLVLISDHTKSLYEDKWYGDVLHYTGMGKRGDQDMFFMQNRTLAESAENGVDLHLFEVFKQKQYLYQGRVVLVGDPFIEIQVDDDEKARKVWMFPLKLEEKERTIPEDIVHDYVCDREKAARVMSDDKLLARVKRTRNHQVSRRIVSSKVYIRDPFVAEYTKRRARGVCQLCKNPAPFINGEGNPYLECHHIHWISEGGSDTVDNTVALCPNCHRRMHVLNLSVDIATLRMVAKQDDLLTLK